MSNPAHAIVHSTSFDQVICALAQVSASLPSSIPTEGERSSRTLLASLLALSRSALQAHGLSMTQLSGADFEDGAFGPKTTSTPLGVACVMTQVSHSSLEFVRTTLRATIADPSSDGVIHSLDDLRLYAMSSILGIACEGLVDVASAVIPAPSAPFAPRPLTNVSELPHEGRVVAHYEQPRAPASPPVVAEMPPLVAPVAAPAPAADTAPSAPAEPMNTAELKREVDELQKLCATHAELYQSAELVRKHIATICKVKGLGAVTLANAPTLQALRTTLEAEIRTKRQPLAAAA